jgi:two-component system LytT family response regulator
MIKTIICDDELHSTETLSYFLTKNCPNIQLLASFNEPLKAKEFLENNKIDLLILDIEMPRLNGFELLKSLQPFDFEVIFLTAYNEFALKAFRFSAFDYFLKPLDEIELSQSLSRLEAKKNDINKDERLDFLMDIIQPYAQKPKKIALPTMEGFEFVELNQIIRFASDSNYVKVILDGQKPLLVCKTLKEIEETLKHSNFIRVHNSHLINTDYVQKYLKNAGGSLLTKDGFEVPISRLRKEFTLSKLKLNA